MRKDKVIVVGSGFSGSILARKIAEELGIKVTVVEKRPHVGGNMYDEIDEHGILVQRYGPHFLHTDRFWIIRFLQQYAKLFPYEIRLLSFIDGQYVRLPFNFKTVQQLVGLQAAEGLLAKFRQAFRGRDRVPVLELVEHSDPDVSAYGNLLFNKAFRTYTAKMWDISPEKIDKGVLDRVPMAMSYDERYLNRDFQYLPIAGYTKLFEVLLDHPNIQLLLNTDALENLVLKEEDHTMTFAGELIDCLIYTGPLDELFGNRFGRLPYRSLDIQYSYFEQPSVLPSEIISYPQAPGYTRSTEYRKIMFDDSGAQGSVVATEYPLTYDPTAKVGNIPYYPVITEESKALYKKYLQEVRCYPNIFCCGRLAEFKYYNMDICIEHAIKYFKEIETFLTGRTASNT